MTSLKENRGVLTAVTLAVLTALSPGCKRPAVSELPPSNDTPVRSKTIVPMWAAELVSVPYAAFRTHQLDRRGQLGPNKVLAAQESRAGFRADAVAALTKVDLRAGAVMCGGLLPPPPLLATNLSKESNE